VSQERDRSDSLICIYSPSTLGPTDGVGGRFPRLDEPQMCAEAPVCGVENGLVPRVELGHPLITR